MHERAVGRSAPILGASALVLALGATAAAQTPGPAPVMKPGEAATEVEAITVTARKYNLNVTVGGDVDTSTMVTSAPVGVYCGGGQYRFERWGSFDQCWLLTSGRQEVLLVASREGRYGAEWTVSWTGCEPFAEGKGCRLTVTGDAVVSAVFTRSRG
jgi:hypothetical protein